MAKIGGNIANFALSGVSFLFGIIILGLSGYLTHLGNELDIRDGYPTGTARFMLFASVWTVVFTILLPLLALTSSRIANIASSAIAGLTVLFLFAGWVAVAAQVHSFAVVRITADGSGGFIESVDENGYRVAAADAAFGAFEWAIWVGITVLTALGGRS